MLKRIVFIVITALSIFSLTGCQKDPKNVAPVDQLDNNTYPKNLTDLETFLVPGYSNFRQAVLYGYQMLPMDVLCSDHTACMTAGAVAYGSKDFATNDISINNTVNAGLWSGLYQGVSDMNVFLDRANYLQNLVGEKSSIDPLRGQAYFLRAYYFMQLECFYGEKYIDLKQPEDPNVLGVPLPIVFATTVQTATLPRSSAYKVWSQIISDLKTAAQDLQGVAPQQGKVNEWAANALLGKAYVFTKEYDSAKVYLKKVVLSAPNSLMSFAQYKNAFNGDPANEYNSESLFEINVDRQVGDGGIIFTSNNNLSLTTEEGKLFGPSILGWNGSESDPSCLNVGGLCQYFVHDKNLRRFGFNLPVPIDTFTNPAYISAQHTSALNPQMIMDTAYQRQSRDLRTNKTVDPRLYVCALQPWVDSCGDAADVAKSALSNAGIPQIGDSVPVTKCYNIDGRDKDFYYGWSFRKYTTTDNSLPNFYGNNDAANLYLLRLADVYLLYAEACHFATAPDDATALEYINKVHRRAYDLPVNSPNPGTGPSYDYATWTSPTMAAPSDVDLANNPLAYERFAELFGEGGWWFDVCRWHMGATEAAYYITATAEYNTSNTHVGTLINTDRWTNGDAYCYPIPSAEIGANAAISSQAGGGQNPGY